MRPRAKATAMLFRSLKYDFGVASDIADALASAGVQHGVVGNTSCHQRCGASPRILWVKGDKTDPPEGLERAFSHGANARRHGVKIVPLNFEHARVNMSCARALTLHWGRVDELRCR